MSEITGRCISCGFLSKYCPGVYVPTPKYFEMENPERESGKVFSHAIDANRGPTPSDPACFLQMADAKADFSNSATQNTPHLFKEAAQKDRECLKWHPYTPGISPQAHLEQVRMQELERKRQEFEERMDRKNKEFTLKLDKRNRCVQIWLSVILGIFALAEVAAALLQVAFPNGWPWLMQIIDSYFQKRALPSFPPM